MVKTFTYVKTNKDGTVEVKERNVFVMAENDNYIRALDFAYVGEDDKKEICEALKDHKVSSIITFGKTKAEPIPNFKDEWTAAFRTFKKENIRQ